MPVAAFYFLLTGMLDETDPEKTDPFEELVQKRLRQMTAASPGGTGTRPRVRRRPRRR